MAWSSLLITVWWLTSLYSGRGLSAQPKYIDEVGHLDTEVDKRKQVRISGIEFSRVDENLLRLRGRGTSGESWTALIPFRGGVGWTSVWSGDFDQNGYDDLLLIAAGQANFSNLGYNKLIA